IGYVTPAARHAGDDVATLAARRAVYHAHAAVTRNAGPATLASGTAHSLSPSTRRIVAQRTPSVLGILATTPLIPTPPAVDPLCDRDHTGFDDALVFCEQREPMTAGRGHDELIDRVGVEASAETRALDRHSRGQGQDCNELARLQMLEAVVQALG